jgi:FixJ family two-component response regulator
MIKKESYVYVIDGDESVRKSLGKLFRSAGLGEETFASTDEFFREPKRTENCCLLVDIRTPGMTCPDFQRNLSERGFHMPVIVVSTSDDARVRDDARHLGAVSFFRKPVDDHALLDAIWWALSSQKRSGVK